jgi:hypothetical protein
MLPFYLLFSFYYNGNSGDKKMIEESSITITMENKLKKEKRDLNVYHQSTRSAHIISHNSSITLPLRTVEEGDFLHISVVSGPGHLWQNCLIDLPSWADFEFSSEGKVTLIHSGDRTLLLIPPGPPTWELKMERQSDLSSISALTEDNVTIGDIEHKPDEGVEKLKFQMRKVMT